MNTGIIQIQSHRHLGKTETDEDTAEKKQNTVGFDVGMLPESQPEPEEHQKPGCDKGAESPERRRSIFQKRHYDIAGQECHHTCKHTDSRYPGGMKGQPGPVKFNLNGIPESVMLLPSQHSLLFPEFQGIPHRPGTPSANPVFAHNHLSLCISSAPRFICFRKKHDSTAGTPEYFS